MQSRFSSEERKRIEVERKLFHATTHQTDWQQQKNGEDRHQGVGHTTHVLESHVREDSNADHFGETGKIDVNIDAIDTGIIEKTNNIKEANSITVPKQEWMQMQQQLETMEKQLTNLEDAVGVNFFSNFFVLQLLS